MSDPIDPTETRESRQAIRRERLELAIANVRMKMEIMSLVMRTTKFQSLLSPPNSDSELRAPVVRFIAAADELQDAAAAFAVFCDCQFPPDQPDE